MKTILTLLLILIIWLPSNVIKAQNIEDYFKNAPPSIEKSIEISYQILTDENFNDYYSIKIKNISKKTITSVKVNTIYYYYQEPKPGSTTFNVNENTKVYIINLKPNNSCKIKHLRTNYDKSMNSDYIFFSPKFYPIIAIRFSDGMLTKNPEFNKWYDR